MACTIAHVLLNVYVTLFWCFVKILNVTLNCGDPSLMKQSKQVGNGVSDTQSVGVVLIV